MMIVSSTYESSRAQVKWRWVKASALIPPLRFFSSSDTTGLFADLRPLHKQLTQQGRERQEREIERAEEGGQMFSLSIGLTTHLGGRDPLRHEALIEARFRKLVRCASVCLPTSVAASLAQSTTVGLALRVRQTPPLPPPFEAACLTSWAKERSVVSLSNMTSIGTLTPSRSCSSDKTLNKHTSEGKEEGRESQWRGKTETELRTSPGEVGFFIHFFSLLFYLCFFFRGPRGAGLVSFFSQRPGRPP